MPSSDGTPSDGSSGTPTRGRIDVRSPTAILGDERAIEGLPIRLVIALVVGVAALSVMMTMIDDTGNIGTSELDAEPEPDTFNLGHRATQDVTITVVDDQGEPIEGATVILQGGSARLTGGPEHAESGTGGEVTFEDVSPELEPNQHQGTLQVDIQPPSSDYQDERDNREILVIGS